MTTIAEVERLKEEEFTKYFDLVKKIIPVNYDNLNEGTLEGYLDYSYNINSPICKFFNFINWIYLYKYLDK